MKKKILALCLVVVLAITAVTGATLAYFTDTDKATNTFTTANVKIELIEKQRDSEGKTLEDFEDGKVLYPIVGSAQTDAKDQFGLTTAKNYVDKIVTVKNLAADAYVRVYYAIPETLDNVTNAGLNVLHVNSGNEFVATGDKTDVNAINADFTAYMGDETFVATTTIGGISYNVYYRDYNKILTKDEETGSAFMVGLYLDQGVDAEERVIIDEDVDMVDGKWSTETVYTITKNGETKDIDFDFSEGVEIPVIAVGVQSAGFGTCADAITGAFGDNYNPFA